MQDMNWDDLRVFLAVARSTTLSDAARKLGVNQTTVTRRLDTLESRLGVRLFDRAPSGVSATAAAADIMHVAERVEDSFASIERHLAGKDMRLTGELRVTTVDMCAHHDAALFESFTRRYPDIELELSVGYLPRNLTRREADVAIRWTDKPPEHLVGHKVATAEYALYAGLALLDRLSGKTELQDFPWVGWDLANNARLTATWMNRHVPHAHVAARYDTALAMHAAIRSGIGIGFMPCAYADLDPQLRRLRPVEPRFGFDIWLLTHPDLRGTARVRAFMQHAAEYFESQQDLFSGQRV